MIDEALALVESDGVAALTMRRLADRLGVNPMTLYLRFENKEELLGAMVGRRLAEIDAPAPDGSLEDRLTTWTCSVRDQLVVVGALLPAVSSGHQLASTMLDGSETGLALIAEAGIDDADAVDALRSLFWHAVAFAVLRPTMHAHAPELLRNGSLSPDDHPNLTRLAGGFGEFDPDDLFERTTRALVRGLVAPTT